ncbi:sensor domain-containing diguanylate cyclase [Legionella fallonii]|uniref:Diguanylate cyclase (GGDEF) domain protein n=1 Tax=Legionella fallonii LLAP-10 TaxID=1212491 RepID=A0A098G5I6_9GAMM|nr:diguanylate cyclase [Legionella fallonii]CEG57241.1 Diguanylate cyclase (GGDEF) domain protein [Legionella fallonii LLAP-10]
MSDLPPVPDNEQVLREEIKRLNKIIKALIDRAEQDMNAPNSDFGVFQTTIMLEDKVRLRTKELEEALHKNAKITRALQQASILIEESEQRLHDITSALGEGLLVMDKEGSIMFINAAACKILLLNEDEVLGTNAHELFHHSYSDGSPYPIQQCMNLSVLQTGQPYSSEDEYFWRSDGTGFHASVIATPIKLKENTQGVVVAFHDITQSIQERNQLRDMKAAIEQSPASVLITDKDKNIIYANPELMRATGYTKAELQNEKASIFHGDLTPGDNYIELWKTILTGAPWNGEILYQRKDGSTFWQSWKVAPVMDNHGVIQNFVAVGEDITEKKKLQTMLQEMSYQDGLTGIANRRRFDEYFSQEWNRALRHGQPLAIIMADLDFFKSYNDSFGHQAGDECLKKIALKLKSNILRLTDLLARYGGEEFVCVLPGTNLAAAKLLAEKLRLAVCSLKLPHPNSTVSPYVTISLGVACCSPCEDMPNNLLKAADAALYQAKTLGRNRVEVATDF